MGVERSGPERVGRALRSPRGASRQVQFRFVRNTAIAWSQPRNIRERLESSILSVAIRQMNAEIHGAAKEKL